MTEDRCQYCGYTEDDKIFHLDHHICEKRQKDERVPTSPPGVPMDREKAAALEWFDKWFYSIPSFKYEIPHRAVIRAALTAPVSDQVPVAWQTVHFDGTEGTVWNSKGNAELGAEQVNGKIRPLYAVPTQKAEAEAVNLDTIKAEVRNAHSLKFGPQPGYIYAALEDAVSLLHRRGLLRTHDTARLMEELVDALEYYATGIGHSEIEDNGERAKIVLSKYEAMKGKIK